MHFSTLFTVALVGLAAAVPSPNADPHELHERRDGAPHAWKRHSRAFKEQVLPIRIGLKQRNLEHGNRFLHDVSDPDSAKFGKHWTAEQVANMFAPAKETSDRTIDWLVNSGIEESRLKHSVGMIHLQPQLFAKTANETFRPQLDRIQRNS